MTNTIPTVISISETIDTVSIVLSFLTLLVVFFTLREMKTQRNNQYKPTIIMERITCNLCENNDMKQMSNQFNFDMNSIIINDSMIVKAKNLGMYPARDVEILIDKTNIKRIMDRFKEIDFSDIEISPDGMDYIYRSNGNEQRFDYKFIFQAPYLLGNGVNEGVIMIPNIYTLLVKKILVCEPFQWDFDYLNIELSVSCSDICGKRYSKKIKLYFDIQSTSIGENGSGGVTFVLSMLKPLLRRYYQM